MADTRLDFLSKEAVSGKLVSHSLARGPISAEEAVRCAIEVGAALHKIHSRGMVHGALSPLCIALGPGGARILRATTSPEDRAAYRAPEQIRGEEPDVLSDVFAYGALVYEIATWNRAFNGAGAELDQRILSQAPARLPADTAPKTPKAGYLLYINERNLAWQRHQATREGVQGRRTAPLALRQRGVALHDERRPHYERVDSRGHGRRP